MTSLIRFLLFALSGAASALASSGYCSLAVDVFTPGGKRPIALVTVTEPDGRVSRQLERSAEARFCDLGLGPVRVEVGAADTCNQVVVNEVPLFWQKLYRLKVTYDPEPCMIEPVRPLAPVCTYLFRVADGSGKWVEGAAVRITPGGLDLRSDSAGRVSVDLGIGPVSVIVSAHGYETKAVESDCTAAAARQVQERLIKLQAR
jgi:hypothetical protein